MNKIKEGLSLIVGSKLVVEGKGRTYAKLPTWVAVLAAVASVRLAIITAVLCVAFGMKASVVKA